MHAAIGSFVDARLCNPEIIPASERHAKNFAFTSNQQSNKIAAYLSICIRISFKQREKFCKQNEIVILPRETTERIKKKQSPREKWLSDEGRRRSTVKRKKNVRRSPMEHESSIYTGYYFPRDARTWAEWKKPWGADVSEEQRCRWLLSFTRWGSKHARMSTCDSDGFSTFAPFDWTGRPFSRAHVALVFHRRLLSPPLPLALFSSLFASELWATTNIFADCGCYLGLMKAIRCIYKGRERKNDETREKLK